MSQIIRIASAVILNSNQEMLVVRKKLSSFFMLPGGKIENGEQLIDALIRELEEELCLLFSESDFTFLGSHTTAAVNENNTLVEGNIFLLNRCIDLESVQNFAEIAEVSQISKHNYKEFKLAHLLSEFAIPKWLNNFK